MDPIRSSSHSLKTGISQFLGPDTTHAIFVSGGEILGSIPLARRLISTRYEYRGPDISKTVDGNTFHTPVLLSAGFDTDGRLTRLLKHLSFGGEEIGSITAFPCEGNPKPRMTLLTRNKSIIVNKGLRNRGVDALINRLKHTPRTPDYVIGISIARTNRVESCTDLQAGIDDFAQSFKRLNEAHIGDYYTLNVSCPNAYGGETFATPEALHRLLARLDAITCHKPVYLKVPINLTVTEFDALIAVADKHGLQGIVCGNLNKEYDDLEFPEDVSKEHRGGLSGKPCFERSNALIRRIRKNYGERFTIIGSGGILTPEDAMQKFRAGADLVQILSGIILGPPSLVHATCVRYANERPHYRP